MLGGKLRTSIFRKIVTQPSPDFRVVTFEVAKLRFRWLVRFAGRWFERQKPHWSVRELNVHLDVTNRRINWSENAIAELHPNDPVVVLGEGTPGISDRIGGSVVHARRPTAPKEDRDQRGAEYQMLEFHGFALPPN